MCVGGRATCLHALLFQCLACNMQIQESMLVWYKAVVIMSKFNLSSPQYKAGKTAYFTKFIDLWDTEIGLGLHCHIYILPIWKGCPILVWCRFNAQLYRKEYLWCLVYWECPTPKSFHVEDNIRQFLVTC